MDQISTIPKHNAHTLVSHLDPLLSEDIGGFIRLLVSFVILEFLGRILLAKQNKNNAQQVRAYLQQQNLGMKRAAFNLAMDELAKLTQHNNYKEAVLKEYLWKEFRNGLTHILLPFTKNFLVGEAEVQRTFFNTRSGGDRVDLLKINDWQFAVDVRNLGEQILMHENQQVQFVTEKGSQKHFQFWEVPRA